MTRSHDFRRISEIDLRCRQKKYYAIEKFFFLTETMDSDNSTSSQETKTQEMTEVATVDDIQEGSNDAKEGSVDTKVEDKNETVSIIISCVHSIHPLSLNTAMRY